MIPLISLPVTGSLLVYLNLALTITRQNRRNLLSLPIENNGVSKYGWFSRRSSSCWDLSHEQHSNRSLGILHWQRTPSKKGHTSWPLLHASFVAESWCQNHLSCVPIAWFQHLRSPSATGIDSSPLWDYQLCHECYGYAKQKSPQNNTSVQRGWTVRRYELWVKPEIPAIHPDLLLLGE